MAGSRTADHQPAIRRLERGGRITLRVRLAAQVDRAYRVRVFFGGDGHEVRVSGGPFLGPDHAIDHARQRVAERRRPAARFRRGEATPTEVTDER